MIDNVEKFVNAMLNPNKFIQEEYKYLPERVGTKAMEIMGLNTGEQMGQNFLAFYESEESNSWHPFELAAIMAIASRFCEAFPQVAFEMLADDKLYGSEVKEAIGKHLSIQEGTIDKLLKHLGAIEIAAEDLGPMPWPEGYDVMQY